MEFDPYFGALVAMLQDTGWVALGKAVSPMTGKVERNLDAARQFIDTLAMLEHKTLGNLTPEEDRLLKSALSSLRLNFLDEAKTPPSARVEEP